MPRILVADDNTNIQKMVALALQDRGIDVTSVGNGEAAVRRLPELNPDLILADIFMPVRNGYELCEWVKTETKYSHIPVILLVGAFDPLDEKEARRVGADGVLKKPFIPPDPLIAMVTSALEKNPRFAAELAKAKEAPAPPPSRPPVAAVEAAPKIEVKPLPEFPEPADDASLAYGFGTGRRGLDDDEIDESAAARAPQSAEEKEAEEAFEGASTTSDWRRSAMEFEIPDEAAQRIPFSSEEEMAAEFPSERGVAEGPQHVPEGIAPAPGPDDAAAQGPESWAIERDAETGSSDSTDELRGTVNGVPSATAATPAWEANAPLVPNRAAESEEELRAAEASEQAPAEESEPSAAPKGSHWMDLMASTFGKSQGHWLSSLIGGRKQTDAPTEEDAADSPSAHRADSAQPHAEGAHDEIDLPGSPGQADAEKVGSLARQSFFTGEAQTDQARAGSAQSEHRASSSDESLVRQDPGQAGEREATVAESVPAAAFEPSPEAVEPASVEPSVRKDPALIEPVGVQVTPEPLLVDESTSGSLSYGQNEPDVAPAYAFLRGTVQSRAPEPTVIEEGSAELAAAEAPAPPRQQSSSLEFSADDLSERIPTIAVPSREALAEIPFLNPPPNFHETAEVEQGAEEQDRTTDPFADSRAVDAVVQRILEKLEPQLHDLLSKNLLKPLIENLVQNELQKKDR